jgi:type VI protein secretion system component Hcp
VDWASTQLFEKCCEAGKAKIAKSKEERDVGTIDKVTVEICKAAGEKKFPFAIIEYSGVRITKFSINMNDPEPTETIEFEYDKFEFKYQPTNSYTGLPEGAMKSTEKFEGRKEKETGTAPGTDSGSSTGGGGGGGAVVTTTATGNSAATTGGSRSSATLTSAVDANVSVNFPGAFPANGLGLLPD